MIFAMAIPPIVAILAFLFTLFAVALTVGMLLPQQTSTFKTGCLLLVSVGALSISCFLWLASPPISLLAAGCLALLLAYLWLLMRFYKAGVPIPTRGGPVEKKAEPVRYKFMITFLALVGVFAAFVIVMVNVASSR